MKHNKMRITLLLFAVLMASVSGCGKETAPVAAVTETVAVQTETTTEAAVETVAETVAEAVIETAAETAAEEVEETEPAAAQEAVEVHAESGMVMDTDENVRLYPNTEAVLQRMTGKTNEFVLDAGELFCDVASEQAGQELQAGGCTFVSQDGLFRVVVTAENGTVSTSADVFVGEVTVTIAETGESIVLKAGEAAVVEKRGEKTAAFVKQDDWAVRSIDYDALPQEVLDRLASIVQSGREMAGALSCKVKGSHEDSETIMTPATCTDEGLSRLTCSLCGDVREETIPAMGHTEEEIPAVEPDCTHDGLTAGARCTVCDTVTVFQQNVPAMGHTSRELPAVPAACEKAGRTAGEECAVCGVILQQQFDTPALAHVEIAVQGHEPTCVETGLTDGVRCSVCDKWIVEQTVIPVHTPEIEVTPGLEATCLVDGYTETHTCTICGHVVQESQVIPAPGHAAAAVAGREPTCTKYGLTEGQRCSVCNVWLEKREIIPMVPHTPEYAPMVDSTCTEPGTTEGMVCADCGKVLEGIAPIAMKEHRIGSYSGYAATCTEYGLTSKLVCLDCDALLFEHKPLLPLGHSVKVISGYAASGCNSGLTDGQVCTACGTELKSQTVIPAPHNPGALKKEKLPDGIPVDADHCCVGKRFCQDCGELLYSQIITHEPGDAVVETLDEGGQRETVKCSYCGFVISVTER